jgi:ABC-2 type transport system ATP-binding protein
VRNLTKRYGETLALDAISLDIFDRELFALLGPNGAGKTTLLHILCTILRPDSGTAMVAGYDVARQPLKARQNLGVVFQEPSLDDRLTVVENLDFHGLVYGVPYRLRKQRIDEMLAVVELQDWRDQLVRNLSSGMKRRLEIARALIHDSSIVFLDEPTVGLDVQSRTKIWEYLSELRRRRDLTVVVTTHYIEEVEGCDRVCIIDHGKVLVEGSPGALRAERGTRLIRVEPADGPAEEAIRARYPRAIQNKLGEMLITVDDAGTGETFLAEFGNRVRSFQIDSPNLEAVFLSLTGRELRDQAANAAERTKAFGRQGGEHTR